MGNSCLGPSLSNDGFLHYVTSSFWRGNTIQPPPEHPSQNTSNPPPVHTTPPPPLKISSAPPEPPPPPQEEKNRIEKENKIENEEKKNRIEKENKIEKEEKKNMIEKEEERNRIVEKNRIGEEEEEQKSASNPSVKRTNSLGLQKQSVLGRRTANLKDVYSLGRKLGQGQFGTTYFCLEKSTGKELACKSISKRKLTTEADLDDVRREIEIMHHLSGHPSVISIVDAYEDSVNVHVVMEICSGGELFDRIIQIGHYSERKAADLARIIVGVVESCHSRGVIHRDLKPENFLFVDHEEHSTLKMIDFGLSIFFKPGEIFTDVVGSPYYVAPEVLRKSYGQECDVWSAGVIIYILLSGVPPFWDETEQGIFEQVLKGKLDFFNDPWPSISESAKDLVKRMLVRDPRRRATAKEVLDHPWIKEEGDAPDKPLHSSVVCKLKEFSAMNKMKRMVIRVMAERVSGGEEMREMFREMDSDGSGSISMEELRKGLGRITGGEVKEVEVSRLMKGADIDQNGSIEYGEFMAAMLNMSKVQKEDNMYAAFSYFDEDGSGYITKEEMRVACGRLGFGETSVEEIIGEVDLDKDGRIDYSEFVAMMMEDDHGFN